MRKQPFARCLLVLSGEALAWLREPEETFTLGLTDETYSLRLRAIPQRRQGPDRRRLDQAPVRERRSLDARVAACECGMSFFRETVPPTWLDDWLPRCPEPTP
jgi:hypothetical protein